MDSATPPHHPFRHSAETPPSFGQPPIPVIPPAIHGTAADLPVASIDALRPEYATPFDGETPWWRPGAFDIARAIGWKWMIVVPCAILVLGLPVAAIFGITHHVGGAHLSGGIVKLAILAGGIVVTVVISAARRGVSVRKEPFCIHCGYSLEGLPEQGTCPECGRAYLRAVIDEFRKDPNFFAMRHAILKRAPKANVFTAGDGPTPDDGTH